jgi:hypothetical protein
MVEAHRCFGGKYCLHLRYLEESQADSKQNLRCIFRRLHSSEILAPGALCIVNIMTRDEIFLYRRAVPQDNCV